jgi:hypothetical protein
MLMGVKGSEGFVGLTFLASWSRTYCLYQYLAPKGTSLEQVPEYVVSTSSACSLACHHTLAGKSSMSHPLTLY